ncbi:MAG: HEAT repeat domain-containing protein [Acidobacteria bacterium]|nr:HEAT repeat domain-containing protein [Acidobacteriota bacterium]
MTGAGSGLAPASPELSWDGAMRLLEALPAMTLAERGEQVELLVRNASPSVRERALHLGANLLSEERIAEHLRNEHDAVLRNAGLEMLKLRGVRSFALAVRLLADPEPDVVLQAVLLLDHLRDPRALEALRGVLAHPDLNVAQAAILAIGRLGDARSIPDLQPFLAADPWLQMAAIQALGDLRSHRAVADLARLLGDPVAGAIAAEALARIGGIAACRALIAHWLGQAGQLDDASLLGLLAHALEGLPRSAAVPADRPAIGRILKALRERLGDPAKGLAAGRAAGPAAEGAAAGPAAERAADRAAGPAAGRRDRRSQGSHRDRPEVRAAAARCVLALGPSGSDQAALAVLAALADDADADADDGADAGRGAAGVHGAGAGEGDGDAGGAAVYGEAARLPQVLRRRPDLAAALLRRPGIAAAWGLQLAALHPRRVAAAEVLGALAGRAGAAGRASAAGQAGAAPRAGTAGQAGAPNQTGAPPATSWPPLAVAAAVRFLGRVPPAQAPDEIGPAVLRLYLGLPAERRAELVPLLRRFRVAVRRSLAALPAPEAVEASEAAEGPGKSKTADASGASKASRTAETSATPEITAVDRVVLGALLGGPGGPGLPGGHPRAVAAEMARLPVAGRLAAIVQLAAHRPVMRALPWAAWLREAPEAHAAAAAEAAVASRLGELLPLLRALPPRLAEPALVRAFAELADGEAVPWLLAVLERVAVPPLKPELRPLVLESLGRIGGTAARRALAAAALDRSAESRLAYRALAACATAEDAPLFRAAVTHPDWYVRLACAEVLGRFAAPEDMASLARLAADPVPAVAHRALSCLAG